VRKLKFGVTKMKTENTEYEKSLIIIANFLQKHKQNKKLLRTFIKVKRNHSLNNVIGYCRINPIIKGKPKTDFILKPDIPFIPKPILSDMLKDKSNSGKDIREYLKLCFGYSDNDINHFVNAIVKQAQLPQAQLPQAQLPQAQGIF
jgi:hypothetical protein